MAARKPPSAGRPWTPEKVRQRIRVSMLVNRLQNEALGKVKLKPGERKAITILLKKALPDLMSVDSTVRGDPDRPLVFASKLRDV